MFQLILGLLTAGLNLWADKEKHKYIDAKIKLETDYYAEINKPDDQRSDAVIADIEQQLHILASAFTAAASATNPGS